MTSDIGAIFTVVAFHVGSLRSPSDSTHISVAAAVLCARRRDRRRVCGCLRGRLCGWLICSPCPFQSLGFKCVRRQEHASLSGSRLSALIGCALRGGDSDATTVIALKEFRAVGGSKAEADECEGGQESSHLYFLMRSMEPIELGDPPLMTMVS